MTQNNGPFPNQIVIDALKGVPIVFVPADELYSIPKAGIPATKVQLTPMYYATPEAAIAVADALGATAFEAAQNPNAVYSFPLQEWLEFSDGSRTIAGWYIYNNYKAAGWQQNGGVYVGQNLTFTPPPA